MDPSKAEEEDPSYANLPLSSSSSSSSIINMGGEEGGRILFWKRSPLRLVHARKAETQQAVLPHARRGGGSLNVTHAI